MADWWGDLFQKYDWRLENRGARMRRWIGRTAKVAGGAAYAAGQATLARYGCWREFWILWLLTGAVFEIVALADKRKGDTLSEQVWSLVSIPGYGKFFAWMIVALMVWAAVHFASKGRFG